MRVRERRSWTKEEDNMLRTAIKLEEPHSDRPSKWHSIARHVPGRTNKDCRKRWCATMASIVSKGGWSAEEDRKLLEAVEKHGTKWSLVTSMVETRNSGQCAKRWNDTLNPEIDRSAWSAEEDAKLLDAVSTRGTSWTTIVKSYFPGRTALAAKNRYSHLSRSSQSRRAPSPTNSSSSADTSDVSSPMPTDAIPSKMEFVSSEDDANQCSINIDSMDFSLTDGATDTPSSSSPSSPPSISPTYMPKTYDTSQMLERFLDSLTTDSNFPECKSGDLFPDHFLSADGSQDLFDPPIGSFASDSMYSLSNMEGLGDAFKLSSEQTTSLWSDVKDFDITPPDLSASGSSSGCMSPSESNPPVANIHVRHDCLQADQQVAVAVAICRADNLRPTVQILIQSLAGAFGQPITPTTLSSITPKT